jgi:hypothetical protein
MNILITIIGLASLVVLMGLLFSLPVMLLWNYCLVGAMTGINEIGWLQAWGILVLFGLLFKSSTTTTK